VKRLDGAESRGGRSRLVCGRALVLCHGLPRSTARGTEQCYAKFTGACQVDKVQG
jgi:hypothetical protein